MRITPEQIYDLAGLKVGDKIRMTSSSRVYTILKNILRGENGLAQSLDLLVRDDFEKVEDKIWDIGEIKEDDIIWIVNIDNKLTSFRFMHNIPTHRSIVIKGMAFKEEKYAEEYLEKLIEFNEKYKKECD